MKFGVIPNHAIRGTAQTDGVYVRGIREQIGKVFDEPWRQFSSASSFKNRNPFRNAGEELVHRLEVFLLEIRKFLQDLLLGHSGSQIRGKVVDREP